MNAAPMENVRKAAASKSQERREGDDDVADIRPFLPCAGPLGQSGGMAEGRTRSDFLAQAARERLAQPVA
jgi:hypothetical protein